LELKQRKSGVKINVNCCALGGKNFHAVYVKFWQALLLFRARRLYAGLRRRNPPRSALTPCKYIQIRNHDTLQYHYFGKIDRKANDIRHHWHARIKLHLKAPTQVFAFLFLMPTSTTNLQTLLLFF
jgi:hypothetical protein